MTMLIEVRVEPKEKKDDKDWITEREVCNTIAKAEKAFKRLTNKYYYAPSKTARVYLVDEHRKVDITANMYYHLHGTVRLLDLNMLENLPDREWK